jgi:hypothetical protein
MYRTVRFFQEKLGFTLLFRSPTWSEFDLGEIRLALRPSSFENLPGKVQFSYCSLNSRFLFLGRAARRLKFQTENSPKGEYMSARFIGLDGMEYTVNGTALRPGLI